MSPQGRKQTVHVDASKLFEQLPPHDVEAEAALLGSMILDWRVCGDVIQTLRGSSDFYKPAHGAIYDQVVTLYDQNQSVDIVQLKDALADADMLERVGNIDYLLELAESVPSAAAAQHYAELVARKSLSRQLIDHAGRVLYDAYQRRDAPADVLDQAQKELMGIADARYGSEESSLGEILQDVYDALEAQDGRLVTGLETGYFDLDEKTSGLQPGELIILAARPSMGKTALALNIMEHAAAGNHQPAAMFSMEMGKQQLGERLVCARARVAMHKLRRNMLSREDFSALSEATGQLGEAPIYIDDRPGLGPLQMRAQARRIQQRHGLGLVVVDYLQLMQAPPAERREVEVATLSRQLKSLARELNVPVLCLSQLNRQSSQREDHRPRMSELRESGSIEQDADVVMLLHREDYYQQADPTYVPTNKAEVILAKQRNGETGTVELFWHGQSMSFWNLKEYGQTPGGTP